MRSMAIRSHPVLLHPHGRTLSVPEDRPILEAALDAGLNLPHSCRSGHCGSCRAQLLRGQIHYPNGTPLGLSPLEAARGEVLLCQALPRSEIELTARIIAQVDEVEIKTLPCRIARLTRLAPDVMQVFLKLPSVEQLRFQPGQYLDVLLSDGRRRSFSIASPPHDATPLELHVRYVPGGTFGELLFKEMAAGALLKIEGPVGQFVYRPGDTPIVMVAGGTGFAPLKSMLRHVLEQGIQRPIHLYWGARQAVDLYEDAQLLTWAQAHPQLRYTAVLSQASSIGAPHQQLGWVHEAMLAEHPDLSAHEVYAAGPPALIEALRLRAATHGANNLYFDSFDYAPSATRQDIAQPAS